MRAFDLRRGGAALPVVDVVEDNLKIRKLQRAPHRFRIVAVGRRFLHASAKVVLGLAVQNRYFVAGLQQFGDQRPADKQRAADYQNSHAMSVG